MEGIHGDSPMLPRGGVENQVSGRNMIGVTEKQPVFTGDNTRPEGHSGHQFKE